MLTEMRLKTGCSGAIRSLKQLGFSFLSFTDQNSATEFYSITTQNGDGPFPYDQTHFRQAGNLNWERKWPRVDHYTKNVAIYSVPLYLLFGISQNTSHTVGLYTACSKRTGRDVTA